MVRAQHLLLHLGGLEGGGGAVAQLRAHEDVVDAPVVESGLRCESGLNVYVYVSFAGWMRFAPGLPAIVGLARSRLVGPAGECTLARRVHPTEGVDKQRRRR